MAQAVSRLGVNFELTVTDPLDLPGGYNPGDVAFDSQGGQWLFAKASEAIDAYALCVLSNALIPLAVEAEAADIATGPKLLGIPQVAVASGNYAWFWRGPGGGVGRGIKVLAANATAGALLHPLSGTPGAVDDANVDEGVIAGLTLAATATTLAATECVATTILTCNLTEVD